MSVYIVYVSDFKTCICDKAIKWPTSIGGYMCLTEIPFGRLTSSPSLKIQEVKLPIYFSSE